MTYGPSAWQQSLIGYGPCVFRPPYGSYNSTTLTLARQRHMKVWTWSVDTETGGYWILKSNGGVANYNAPWNGSMTGTVLTMTSLGGV